MKKLFGLLFIILVGYFLNCQKETAPLVKIGVILPLTGDVATYGQSVKKGLDIAFGNTDSTGFKPIYEDSRADKKTAINALEKLFFEQINFFIGDATSSVTYEIGPRIQAKNGLLIVPIATGDGIKEIGENIFMISPRNEKQTGKIARFIKEQFPGKKLGCFFKQNDYGVNIANTFFSLFDDDVYSQAYQDGQSDFKRSLLKFQAERIGVVFLPGNYGETATILRQAKEINYRAIFIGTDGAYSPDLIELAGEASEGFLLAMMPVDYESKVYKDFKRLFSQKYNSEPNIFDCYGYESGLIMMAAVSASPSHSTKDVRTYLQSQNFESLTGTMHFEKEEKPERLGWEANRDYRIYIVKNGKFSPYKWATEILERIKTGWKF